jgi:hypothetical protein
MKKLFIINISDEKRLLTLVPKGHKKNARLLLKQFDERGSELTWNSGNIEINFSYS